MTVVPMTKLQLRRRPERKEVKQLLFQSQLRENLFRLSKLPPPLPQLKSRLPLPRQRLPLPFLS